MGKFQIVAVSSCGGRAENQDRLLLPDGELLSEMENPLSFQMESGKVFVAAVFDGMGGEEKGGELAELAARELQRLMREKKENWVKEAPRDEELKEMLGEIDRKLCKYQQEQAVEGGTTVTLLLFFASGEVGLYNLGDSPAYLLREGKLRQLSQEHSLRGMKLEMGLISREEYARKAEPNFLLAYLGDPTGKSKERIFNRKEELRPGDLFFLCSDGVTDEFSVEQLEKILARKKPEKAVKEILRKIKKKENSDNASMILLRF